MDGCGSGPLRKHDTKKCCMRVAWKNRHVCKSWYFRWIKSVFTCVASIRTLQETGISYSARTTGSVLEINPPCTGHKAASWQRLVACEDQWTFFRVQIRYFLQTKSTKISPHVCLVYTRHNFQCIWNPHLYRPVWVLPLSTWHSGCLNGPLPHPSQDLHLLTSANRISTFFAVLGGVHHPGTSLVNYTLFCIRPHIRPGADLQRFLSL